MDSTLDDKPMERQLASLEELFSNLAREAGVNPSDPPTSTKTFRAPLATIHRLANWRYLAFVSLLELVLLLGGGRRHFVPRWQRFIDWRIGATWPSSALCWQLVLLLGGGRPPLIRR